MIPLENLAVPINFKYVQPESQSRVTYRGFTVTNSEKKDSTIFVGESSDITKYVQDYFFNGESGELTVSLKPDNKLFYTPSNKVDKQKSETTIFAIDAVLNQLAIAIFEMPMGSSETQTIGLLNGSKKIFPRLAVVPGMVWSRQHYDDHSQREIDFTKINDFAFNILTYQNTLDGNRFTIKLKDEYKDNPCVLYAVHDVLGRGCGIKQKL